MSDSRERIIRAGKDALAPWPLDDYQFDAADEAVAFAAAAETCRILKEQIRKAERFGVDWREPVDALLSEIERETPITENKDGAELIGQTIPDMAGTEPRLSIPISANELDWVEHAARLRRLSTVEYVRRAINLSLRQEGVDAVLLAEDEDCDEGPTCESCNEPATHITADDVDMCAECYQLLCDEQGVTGEDASPAQKAQTQVDLADAGSETLPNKVIEGVWGYACVEADAVFIPAVMATPEYPLRRVLAELFAETGQRRMIFSAILDPDDLRPRLRNIVREWDEYVPQLESNSHCIEIRYEAS